MHPPNFVFLKIQAMALVSDWCIGVSSQLINMLINIHVISHTLHTYHYSYIQHGRYWFSETYLELNNLLNWCIWINWNPLFRIWPLPIVFPFEVWLPHIAIVNCNCNMSGKNKNKSAQNYFFITLTFVINIFCIQWFY